MPSVPSVPRKSCFRSSPVLFLISGRMDDTTEPSRARLRGRGPSRASCRSGARAGRRHWWRWCRRWWRIPSLRDRAERTVRLPREVLRRSTVTPLPTTTVIDSGSTGSIPVIRSVERVIWSDSQRMPSTRPVAPPRGTMLTPISAQTPTTRAVSAVSRGRTRARAPQGSVGRVHAAGRLRSSSPVTRPLGRRWRRGVRESRRRDSWRVRYHSQRRPVTGEGCPVLRVPPGRRAW